MSDKRQDYIEIGSGTESKIIGANNTISEYGTTFLALAFYLVQGAFVAFVVIFLILYMLDFTWVWAMILSLIITAIIAYLTVRFTFYAMEKLKRINEPLPVRDERGRFTAAPLHRGGKYQGSILTGENGDSVYVERWGGGDGIYEDASIDDEE